jgi:hypothetical protein
MAGVVYGAGRSKYKKLSASREFVIPANPKTTGQVNVRNRLSITVETVKLIGGAIYTFDWNRAVRQLPGFQSLIKLINNATNKTTHVLSAPAAVSLGKRHFPATWSAAAGVDVITVTWSTEDGYIGADTDEVTIIAISTAAPTAPANRTVTIDQSAVRSDGTIDITATGVSTGDFVVGIYLQDTDLNQGDRDRRSEAKWLVIS